jgi:fumarate hydratase class I
MYELTIPIPDDAVRELHIGDTVFLTGTIITGRDAAHKWMIENFIQKTREPLDQDIEVYEALRPILDGGAIYHCGPVVAGLDTGQYQFVAAGPTTSTREEPYQSDVMKHFNAKAVIGKGGMGPKTLLACQEVPCVYLHAIGGAASLIAESVKHVEVVYKLDFGVPEAMWVISVVDFPSVVTMDSHGESLHERVLSASQEVFNTLVDA